MRCRHEVCKVRRRLNPGCYCSRFITHDCLLERFVCMGLSVGHPPMIVNGTEDPVGTIRVSPILSSWPEFRLGHRPGRSTMPGARSPEEACGTPLKQFSHNRRLGRLQSAETAGEQPAVCAPRGFCRGRSGPQRNNWRQLRTPTRYWASWQQDQLVEERKSPGAKGNAMLLSIQTSAN
jgi:hypothetical protein